MKNNEQKGTLPSAKTIAVVGSKAPVENAYDSSVYRKSKKFNSFYKKKLALKTKRDP